VRISGLLEMADEIENEGETGEDTVSDTVVVTEAIEVAAPLSEEAKNVEEEGSSKKEKKKKPAKVKKPPVEMFRELTPEQAALPWYAVHAYSGSEMRAKLNIEDRVKKYNLEHRFGNILVPQDTVEELVKGKKRTSTRRSFPGYIFVQMDLDETTWHLVKDTAKVTGFVGDSRNPSPISQAEVDSLIAQLQGGGIKPKAKVTFEQGDSVKVIDGPFTDYNGTVDEVKLDKGKLRVLLSIFGRHTPVELDFIQVEKTS